MLIKLLNFGIAKEIIGRDKLNLLVGNSINIKELKIILNSKYPKLKDLPSYSIAVNTSYVKDSIKIHPGDEIAIIPPTNGG